MSFNMATLAISQIIENAAKLKTAEKKANYLREHDTDTLRYILELAFYPGVTWQLPEGAPPYRPTSYLDQEGRLYQEARTLPMYLTGNNPELGKVKREMLFISLLESLFPKDAELLIAIKDKKVTGIDVEVVNLAFPGLIPT
jgi:hypothetical protein